LERGIVVSKSNYMLWSSFVTNCTVRTFQPCESESVFTVGLPPDPTAKPKQSTEGLTTLSFSSTYRHWLEGGESI